MGSSTDNITRAGQLFLLGFQKTQPLLNQVALKETGDARCDYSGDHRRRQFTEIRQQIIMIFIELPYDARAFANRPVV